jgi:molybdopterin-containing oxidoreductase family iron-sulfur binding subunit
MTLLNLAEIRAKLEGSKGREFWRSLEEVAGTKEFQQFLADEFPSRIDAWRDGTSRREMLRVMGAMFAMAGLSGCTKQPQEKIYPYVQQPEEIVPGRPLYFATAMPLMGSAMGLLVESHEGRPTKVEGNPQHPESLGRTLPFQQGAPLSLYDPDRSQAVTYRGRISTWGRFISAMAELRQTPDLGKGFHILSHTVTSPTLDAQRRDLLARYPGMRWHEYEPLFPEGNVPRAIYRTEAADVIVALDSDLLYARPGSIPFARGYMSRRRAGADRARMNRLYVAEPTPTVTGDVADHRLPVKALDIEKLVQAIAGRLGSAGAQAPAGLSAEMNRWAEAVAADLQAHRGTSLIVAGEQQPASVHAQVRSMNESLGNVGTTVTYPAPAFASASGTLGELNEAMKAGSVRTLLILGANPVYDAPGDLAFVQNLDKVPLRIHHGLYVDETSHRSHWHIPESHFLESWSDAVAYDGTPSIIQPLIAPIYDTRSAHEVLAALTDNPDLSGYQVVRQFWQIQRPGEDFEQFWEQSLHDGIIAGGLTTAAAKTAAAAPPAQPSPSPQSGELEIVFRPDPCVWDGRFANNAWLQELPKPQTKLTWENAAYVSPATAERLDLQNEDVVELEYRGRKINAPVWIVPGQAVDSVTVFLGYGRVQAGTVGTRIGYNANLLRTLSNPHADGGLVLRKTGRRHSLAKTQGHHAMEGRDIVRSATNAEFVKNPRIVYNEEKERMQVELSLYPEWKYEGYRWAMAIDQTACIGCNACIIACQSENNIPVVGKDQVARGREMHWLRVDRYSSGPLDNPETYLQPVPCMHCEKAPCEPVCPVAATIHSGDGLNQMIYNRCVGTRYCSNNCPYKVRRFNYLLFTDWDNAAVAALRNPDVTVRSRGVMEKCTYCVQRIQAARIESEKEGRRIQEGEVVTACQGVCPTDAIVFGDMNDKTSRVFQLKSTTLNYSLLAELGTQPRTTYLAKLTNPNPALETSS